MKALLSALLFASLALAGCSGGDGGRGGGGVEPLPADKGAISGLLIDDVYRPVPEGLVLLQPSGLTATTDGSGQFSFTDLEPGAYILRVQAEGHETAPQNIDVVAGEYSEAEVVARRVFSEGSRIVTSEYSMFISCSADYVVNGGIIPCLGDLSGDSDRAELLSNYTGYQNVTYLVTEMKANKVNRYEVQVRCETEEEWFYYSVAQFEGDYVKLVMKIGEADREHEAIASYGENQVWTNDCELHTILFTDSQFREELQDAGAPVCCGVGVHAGIKAKFVQSLFIGEPEMDIHSYAVLA